MTTIKEHTDKNLVFQLDGVLIRKTVKHKLALLSKFPEAPKKLDIYHCKTAISNVPLNQARSKNKYVADILSLGCQMVPLIH